MWYTVVVQVFVPQPDIVESLNILDKRRLAKQRVEAKQLIDTILNRPMANGQPRTGWRNHPAAVMFRQYLPCLIYYYNMSLVIHEGRGGKNEKLQPESLPVESLDDIVYPHWWGDDSIHRTHRGRLLFKGKLDVLADRIKRHTGERGANAWLKRKGLPTLNECRQPEWEYATGMLDLAGAEQSPLTNYYLQFGWTEPDTLEYLWPGETPSEPNRLLR